MKLYMDLGNGRISYTIRGRGDVLVLLHGFTESREIWDSYAEALSEEFRVICPDLPGHGGSSSFSEVHTMEFMAEVTAGVLDHHGIDSCVIIGHSMGGYVALAFAEAYPDRVKGLGLFHSSAYADSPEVAANRLRAVNAVKSSHASFVSAFIPELFTEANRRKYDTQIERLVTRAAQMSAESLVASINGMKERPDRSGVLERAAYPVLFIAGKLDQRVPFDKILEQLSMPRDCVALLMGDVAHMGYIEAQSKCLYAITTFTRGCY